MPANMDNLSGCSIQQLRHLASEHRVDIYGLTDKHELVNALQEAVPEALLLQEAAPSRPLAAPSRALAAPMGGGAGMPANMSLVHPGMRQNRLALAFQNQRWMEEVVKLEPYMVFCWCPAYYAWPYCMLCGKLCFPYIAVQAC